MKLRERIGKEKSFYIDYREDGIRKRHLLKNIHDKPTAEIALADFKLRMAREEVGLASEPNLGLRDCLRAYCGAKEATCTAGHVKHLETYIAQMETFFGAEIPVRALNEASANSFRAHLKAAGDCAGTINRKMSHLKAALAGAVKARKIGRNPLAGLGNLSDARKPVWRFLAEEEAEALLAVLREGTEKTIARKNGRPCRMKGLGRNPKLYQLCLFLLNTGARRGEAMGLTWRDVDLGRKIVTLHTTKAAASGRKAKPRYIPMNAALYDLLEAMAGERKGEKVFAMSGNNLRRKFERACELAGIGHTRFHDLRHSFGSALAMAGVPLHVIQALLGHTSLAMTMRYSHFLPSATSEAVAALNFGAQNKGAKIVSIGGMGA